MWISQVPRKGLKEKWKKMVNENKEEIQNSMITMENILLERPKRDVEIQENHENKDKNDVENQSHMGSMLSTLERTNLKS